MSTKAKVRRYAEDVIMACLVIIMIFSGWKIYTIIKDYRDNQNAYDTFPDSRGTESSPEISISMHSEKSTRISLHGFTIKTLL